MSSRGKTTYARPKAKHDVIPILSVFRVCKVQILCMGSNMIMMSPMALVAIRDWIMGIYRPHSPWAVHWAEMGLHRKMQAPKKAIIQRATKPRVIFEASCIQGVTKTRMKKNSMLALTAARRMT